MYAKDSTTVTTNDAPARYRDDDRSTWGRGYGRLAGRNALVTGSTRGLGRTMIDWLAREGANIVVSGREQADVDASVAAMRDLGVFAFDQFQRATRQAVNLADASVRAAAASASKGATATKAARK